jgi:hypothetical protein
MIFQDITAPPLDPKPSPLTHSLAAYPKPSGLTAAHAAAAATAPKKSGPNLYISLARCVCAHACEHARLSLCAWGWGGVGVFGLSEPRQCIDLLVLYVGYLQYLALGPTRACRLQSLAPWRSAGLQRLRQRLAQLLRPMLVRTRTDAWVETYNVCACQFVVSFRGSARAA